MSEGRFLNPETQGVNLQSLYEALSSLMGEENVQVGGMEVNSFYFPGHIRPHEEVSKYKISLSPQITQ